MITFLATVALYLDFINLFWFLVQILLSLSGGASSRRELGITGTEVPGAFSAGTRPIFRRQGALMNTQSKILVALDTDTAAQALDWAGRLQGEVAGFKVGLGTD